MTYEFDFYNDECSCEFNEDNIIFTVDDLKLNFDDIEWDQKLKLNLIQLFDPFNKKYNLTGINIYSIL
jgi:hypothetical protein